MVINDSISSHPLPIPVLSATDLLNSEPQVYQNDDLDDVFGSTPSSPLFEYSESVRGEVGFFGRRNTEVSDIPRLREKHETEGYRDGVTKGKAQTVQKGFDEGYRLGAILGLRCGKVLGLLEGVVAGVRAGQGSSAEGEEKWMREKKRVEALLSEAKEDLKTERVFGREWWGEDGIWKFEVPGDSERNDVSFQDVANAHPLIKKWEAIAEGEVSRWEFDMEIMNREHEEGDAKTQVTSGEKSGESSMAPGSAKELSW